MFARRLQCRKEAAEIGNTLQITSIVWGWGCGRSRTPLYVFKRDKTGSAMKTMHFTGVILNDLEKKKGLWHP